MNDIKKAIEYLYNQMEIGKIESDYQQAIFEIAISALEKQMLKPVKITKPGPGMTDTTCSICGKFLDERAKDDYCYGCGQKLDWSMEDE